MENLPFLELQPLKLECRFEDEDFGHVPPDKSGVEKKFIVMIKSILAITSLAAQRMHLKRIL